MTTTHDVPPSYHARHRATGATALAIVALTAGLATAAGRPASASNGGALTTVRLVAGPSIRDGGGNLWASDGRYAHGGTVSTTTAHIAGTRHQRLFRSERVGTFDYTVPVPAGTYRVSVNTAEHVLRKRGQRVFEVMANGVTRTRGVDAVARAGALHAVSVTFDVEVTTPELRLRFPAGRRGAAVSSVVLRELRRRHQPTPGTPPTTPVTPTAPTAPTTPTAPPTVTPQDFGAVGDGVTDDTAALQRTFDGADGRTVVLPAGKVYAHSAVLFLRVTGLHVTGPGELLATREATSSVFVVADDVLLDNLLIKNRSTTQRWGTWDQMGVRLDNHRGITLRSVTIDGSAAAGLYVGGATDFTLDHVTVQHTRADGIHMTQGSSHGTVIAPTVIDSGDDGVAIVSYQSDGVVCHDITVTSPRVLGTTWGRGLSVVGGTDIAETGIDVENSSAAGVYIAAEGDPWNTAAPARVQIAGGRIVGANTDTGVDHGAVLVLSARTDVVPSDVTVRDLTVTDTRATVTRDLGVITYGASPARILFSDIAITGGPRSAYQGNTDQSAYRLRGIVQNGVRLPDAG